MTNITKITLTDATYNVEGVNIPETINATVSPETMLLISKAQEFLKLNPDFDYIKLNKVAEFEEIEGFKAGLEGFKVFEDAIYYCLYGKYDMSEEIEFLANFTTKTA